MLGYAGPSAGRVGSMRGERPVQKIPLVLTRPEGANAAFAAEFPKTLAEQLAFIDCPLLRILPTHAPVVLDADTAVIFTSVNGVRHAPNIIGRRAYCVGVRTTHAAQAAGWDAVCAGQNAQELVAEVARVRPRTPLCHLSGVHVRGDIAETLQSLGVNVRRVAVYDQELLPLTAAASRVLLGGEPVIVPLFSPRIAAHFAAIAPVSSQLRVVTLSAAVTDSIGEMPWFEVVTAQEPTADAVISLVQKQVAEISLG